MDTEELYKALSKKVGKKPIKIKDLAAKIGLVSVGQAVGANNAARMRLQLKKLAAAGVIVIEGARATTTYRKA